VTQATTAELIGGDGLSAGFDTPAEAEAALTVLGQAGRNVHRGVEAAGLTVAGGAGEGSAIVRMLASAGIYPAEVRVDRVSLESVFLELTREVGQDEVASAAGRGLA
jgi:hypothetical protein